MALVLQGYLARGERETAGYEPLVLARGTSGGSVALSAVDSFHTDGQHPTYKTVKARYTTVEARYKTVTAIYKTVMARYKTVKARYKADKATNKTDKARYKTDKARSKTVNEPGRSDHRGGPWRAPPSIPSTPTIAPTPGL